MNKEQSKKNFFIKELNYKDVTKQYVKWLNNYDVMKYSDHASRKHTSINVIRYVKEKQKSKIEFLYGIFIKSDEEKKLIGTIKLGPNNKMHRNSSISYIIGDKKYWNKGYATKAISEIIRIAKSRFKLKKLMAGVIAINHPGARRVLEKNKFKIEGIFKSYRVFNKKRYNNLMYGLKL
tara:strand:- start:311 stop:844 length:534 start_codon:yes stop_codon:yes gene_type:complete